jgi:hypothetical protein
MGHDVVGVGPEAISGPTHIFDRPPPLLLRSVGVSVCWKVVM